MPNQPRSSRPLLLALLTPLTLACASAHAPGAVDDRGPPMALLVKRSGPRCPIRAEPPRWGCWLSETPWIRVPRPRPQPTGAPLADEFLEPDDEGLDVLVPF